MKAENFLIEYVRRLSDEELRTISSRFSQNLFGDKAEIAEFLSRSNEVDRWLRTAASSDDYFSMMDVIEKLVVNESDRRSQSKDDKKPRRYSKVQINGNTTS